MLSELIRAFILIFFAEMGDKTQLIAMTFATQYKIKDVLLGVVLGITLNHGIAILLGRLFSQIIPIDYIQIIAGIVFIVFAYLSLIEEEEEEDDHSKDRKYGPIITVGITFFLGELGDKSQLAAMTLSAEGIYPLITLLGTVTAMTVTSGMGILVGSYLGDKIPDLAIKIVSSMVFYSFGVLKLIELINLKVLLVPLIIASIIEVVLINRLIKKRKNLKFSQMQIIAQKLYEQTKAIKYSLDSICLGEVECGECLGKDCFVGYIRCVLDEARKNGDYILEDFLDMDGLIKKDLDEDKVLEALVLIIETSEEYNWSDDKNFVINKIRKSLEEYLFNDSIDSMVGTLDYINECKDKNEFIGRSLENLLDY